MILIIFDKMGDKLTLNLDSYGEQTVTSDDHHDELMLSSNCTLGEHNEYIEKTEHTGKHSKDTGTTQ